MHYFTPAFSRDVGRLVSSEKVPDAYAIARGSLARRDPFAIEFQSAPLCGD